MTDLKSAATVAVALAMLVGCADLSQTQQRTLTGAAGGAAGGAVIGAIAGNAALGAGIGAAAGAGGGWLYGRHKEAEQRAFQQGVATGRAGG